MKFFSKIKTKKFLMVLISAMLIFPLGYLVQLPLSALTLDGAWIRLSRMQSNLNGAGGNTVIMFVGFVAKTTTSSNSTLVIDFATDTGWCRTAGALSIDRNGASGADVLDALTEASTLTGTNYQVDAYIPDGTTIAASCATSGNTITITNIGNMTAGTTYGFYLSNGSSAGVIGTPNNTGETAYFTLTNGANQDVAAFDVELVSNDKVTINATVSDAPTISCTINGGGTVSLGTLFRGGTASNASHTVSTSTSSDATNGYYWVIYGTGDGTDAGLYKSSATTYLIISDDAAGSSSTKGATVNLTTTSEGFGVNVGAGSETLPTNFNGTSATKVGYLGNSGVGGAQLLMYKTSAQTSTSNATIRYYARAGATAQTGSYTETVTLVCGLYF
jgi:hypothetical protein